MTHPHPLALQPVAGAIYCVRFDGYGIPRLRPWGPDPLPHPADVLAAFWSELTAGDEYARRCSTLVHGADARSLQRALNG